MGTAAIQRPHDVLQYRPLLPGPGPAIKSRRKNFPRSSTPPATTPVVHPVPKRSCLSANPKSRGGRRVVFSAIDDAMVVKFPSKPLVMEQVTILKRGEEIASKEAVNRSSDVVGAPIMSNTDPIGPEPQILPRKVLFADRRGVYAGPGFFSSPSPSSLPFPSLLVKKGHSEEVTKGLRCLLGLHVIP